MRLTSDEARSIKRTFVEIFGEGEIYLFGSRVDPYARGGDIDLYLSPRTKEENLREKKIAFLAMLDTRIGEQKIDAVLATDPDRLIEREALRYGVKL